MTATHLYSDGARVNTKLARLRLVSGDKKAKKGLRSSNPCHICTGIGLTVAVLHAVRAALSRAAAAAAASPPRPAGAGKGRHDRKRLLREAQSAFDKQQAEMNRQPMPALALQRDSSSEPTTSEDEARPCPPPLLRPAPPEPLLARCTRDRAGTRDCSRAEGDA